MSDSSQKSTGTGSTLLEDSGVDQSAQPTRSWLSRLYTGTGAFEVVGRRRFYYTLTGVIVLICLLSMVVRGFTLGIDFEGGTKIQVPADGSITSEQVETVFTDTLGFGPEAVQTVGSGAAATVQVRSEALEANQVDQVRNA
ncbi:MAG: protein translocase subunit SecF, partial [Rhodococcus sp. (in: high G+C Gram-positive bacteria)]